MRLLIVLAHPVAESFAAGIAEVVIAAARSAGHEIDFLDLYGENFDPRLTAHERRNYNDAIYDASAVAGLTDRLQRADGLVLVFPTWWFGMPAILKGFFDRVFAPGIAFEMDGAKLSARLGNIRTFVALTTTGAPWWIVRLHMGDPVARMLKRAIAGACMPKTDFRMLSLYNMDSTTPAQRQKFLDKVGRMIIRL